MTTEVCTYYCIHTACYSCLTGKNPYSFLLFLVFHPTYYLGPTFPLQLPPFPNSYQPLGHIYICSGHSSPLPTAPGKRMPSVLSGEDFSIVFPRRLESNCAYIHNTLLGATCSNNSLVFLRKEKSLGGDSIGGCAGCYRDMVG